MRLYISGKITGLLLKDAIANFEEAESHYTKLGFDVINPMKHVPFEIDKTWKEYMVEDIELLLDCEGVVMLPNWRDSKGARIEHSIAVETGMEMFYK